MSSEKSSRTTLFLAGVDNNESQQSGSDSQLRSNFVSGDQHSAPLNPNIELSSAGESDEIENTDDNVDDSDDYESTSEELPPSPPTTFKWDGVSVAIALRVSMILMESYIVAATSPASRTNMSTTTRGPPIPAFRFSRRTQTPQSTGTWSSLFSDPIVPLPHLFHVPTTAPVSTMTTPSPSTSIVLPTLILPPPPPITPTSGNPAPPSIINNLPFAYISHLLPPPIPNLGHIGVTLHPTVPNTPQQPVRKAGRARLEHESKERIRERIEESRRRDSDESAGIIGLIGSILGGKGKRKRDDEDDDRRVGKKGRWIF